VHAADRKDAYTDRVCQFDELRGTTHGCTVVVRVMLLAAEGQLWDWIVSGFEADGAFRSSRLAACCCETGRLPGVIPVPAAFMTRGGPEDPAVPFYLGVF